ncbi:hypothetical protein ACWCPT_09030 [Streptomyces sp. NPDC002308]
MLWHAISPVSDTERRSKALVRSRRMNSDAKIILLYVESLPAEQLTGLMGPLWDYARAAGVESGPYKKAKKFLQREGHLHQWSYQFGPGRWATAQILSNAPITSQEAKAVWASREQETVWSGEGSGNAPGSDSHRGPGRRSSWGPGWGPAGEAAPWGASPQVAPSDVGPAVGLRGGRRDGGYLPDGQLMARSSHLPTCVVEFSNAERVPFEGRFEWGLLLADEDDSGFWAEPPEWLVEQDPMGTRATPPVAGPAADPTACPVPAGGSVPESGPVPERVPVPVPVPAAASVATDAGEEPEKGWTSHMVLAEEVLLSLGKESKQLRLGVPEARRLVDKAAEWLRRGMSAADMRYVLSSRLPEEGVRTPVGFLWNRLLEKMPPEPGRRRAVTAVEPGASRPRGVDRTGVDGTEYVDLNRIADLSREAVAQVPLVECEGPGDVHMFRAHENHTKCGDCRQDEAFRLWAAKQATAARDRGEVLTGDGKGGWRDRLAAIAAEQEEEAARAGTETGAETSAQAGAETGRQAAVASDPVG